MQNPYYHYLSFRKAGLIPIITIIVSANLSVLHVSCEYIQVPFLFNQQIFLILTVA